jgi:hypothetical protein
LISFSFPPGVAPLMKRDGAPADLRHQVRELVRKRTVMSALLNLYAKFIF